MKLTDEVLKCLLEEAFEEGWKGCLDLKEGVVDSLLERARSESQPEKQPVGDYPDGYIRVECPSPSPDGSGRAAQHASAASAVEAMMAVEDQRFLNTVTAAMEAIPLNPAEENYINVEIEPMSDLSDALSIQSMI